VQAIVAVRAGLDPRIAALANESAPDGDDRLHFRITPGARA